MCCRNNIITKKYDICVKNTCHDNFYHKFQLRRTFRYYGKQIIIISSILVTKILCNNTILTNLQQAYLFQFQQFLTTANVIQPVHKFWEHVPPSTPMSVLKCRLFIKLLMSKLITQSSPFHAKFLHQYWERFMYCPYRSALQCQRQWSVCNNRKREHMLGNNVNLQTIHVRIYVFSAGCEAPECMCAIKSATWHMLIKLLTCN